MRIIIIVILRLTFKNNYFTINGSLEKKYWKNAKSNVILGI